MASPDTLQIVGAGWCRTGTSSLKVALDALGFGPCFHGRFIPYLPEFREDCHAYVFGGSPVFDVQKHFGHYRAAVDIPAGLIPLVLDEYGTAKVCACVVCNLLFPFGLLKQFITLPTILVNHPHGALGGATVAGDPNNTR